MGGEQLILLATKKANSCEPTFLHCCVFRVQKFRRYIELQGCPWNRRSMLPERTSHQSFAFILVIYYAFSESNTKEEMAHELSRQNCFSKMGNDADADRRHSCTGPG